MAITLGIAPEPLTVNLYDGSPFDAALEGDWIDGTVVELRFKGDNPTTWSTTVADGVATFAEDSAAVDGRTSGEKVEMWVDGSAWAVGLVALRGR